jgi:hypothetical protein
VQFHLLSFGLAVGISRRGGREGGEGRPSIISARYGGRFVSCCILSTYIHTHTRIATAPPRSPPSSPSPLELVLLLLLLLPLLLEVEVEVGLQRAV